MTNYINPGKRHDGKNRIIVPGPSTSAVEGASIPVGTVWMFLLPEAPDGWVELNGQTISYDEAPELGDALGRAPGSTYALPNITNRVPMGGGTLGALGGSNSRTVSTPYHNHSASGSSGNDTHDHGVTALKGDNMGKDTHPHDNNSAHLARAGGTQGVRDDKDTSNDTHNHSISVSVNYTGTSSAQDFTPAHVRMFFAVYTGN